MLKCFVRNQNSTISKSQNIIESIENSKKKKNQNLLILSSTVSITVSASLTNVTWYSPASSLSTCFKYNPLGVTKKRSFNAPPPPPNFRHLTVGGGEPCGRQGNSTDVLLTVDNDFTASAQEGGSEMRKIKFGQI